MRRMDWDLIERVYGACVQWWGGYGQTTRPYLWKEKPADTGYKGESPGKICGRTGRRNGTKLPLSKDRRGAGCRGGLSFHPFAKIRPGTIAGRYRVKRDGVCARQTRRKTPPTRKKKRWLACFFCITQLSLHQLFEVVKIEASNGK